jgi:hypothetical protein
MMMLIVFESWGGFALTSDVSSWHFPPVAVVLVLLAAVAVHGFWAATPFFETCLRSSLPSAAGLGGPADST